MHKYILLLSFSLLCACSQTKISYYPYVGNKTVDGEGGFLETVIFSEEISTGFFDEKQEYKYDSVVFFKQGLPEGSKCKLAGYISYGKTWTSSYEQMKEIAKSLLEKNINVATQSTISLPIKFNENDGLLHVGASGNESEIYNAYGDTIGSSLGYVLFECE